MARKVGSAYAACKYWLISSPGILYGGDRIPQRHTARDAKTIGDELVWNHLSIAVRLTLDADLIGVAPQMWWQDGVARLRAVFATDRVRLQPDRQLMVTGETAGTVATIG